MRFGSIITLVVAIVVAGLAAALAKVWLESQVPEQQIVQAPSQKLNTRTVVVASRPLNFGMELSRSNLKVVDWPSEGVPQGAFSNFDALLKGEKRSVLSAIAQNEPVLKWKITGPGQRASLSALIDQGDKKAVSIRVHDVSGVGGFVLPGDRVDIFLTRKDPTTKAQFTDLLLQNIKVLAVDQLADDRTEKPKVVKTVTVEVNTVAAQKLVLASSAGQLSLALRRAGATAAAGGRRITLGDLGISSVGSDQKEVSVVEKGDLNSLIGVVRGVKRTETAVPKQ
jgi:pilus assembly protein CpaB